MEDSMRRDTLLPVLVRVRAGPVTAGMSFMTRPQDLADRLRVQSDGREIKDGDFAAETFTLPVAAARHKVRDILDHFRGRGSVGIVERWRQLPDGKIEFTIRRVDVGLD